MKHRSLRRPALSSFHRRAGHGRPRSAPHRLVQALTACSLLTCWPGAADVRAQALPSGMTPIAGTVSSRTVGGTMTVTNSPNSIINWNSFSIGAGNAVRFEQASAASQVLNRVTGNDPSAILGSLSSNGRVWLLNPNGVLFGQSARIDVAGLVTSTLNLNNADWLAGNIRFTQGAGAPASIVNRGELRSSLGGEIALIGATVRNEGEINAPGGRVVLAAGSSVELVDSATPNVSVKVNSTAGEVVNLGSLLAAGGRIDVHAGTVNQSGIVRADSLAAGPGGEVVLQASERLMLAGASETSAISANGQGGKVKLLGREVGLLDSARVDVSGASGGGEVLVGGGQQGKDASVPNARAVYFAPAATITADATQTGDGGKIILWSDEATRAFGSLSARGGPDAGNGGFVETSGGWLDARPARIDTVAPRGQNGTWLLDPFNIVIGNLATDGGTDANFNAVADNARISTATLKAALEGGNSVVVTTGNAGNTGTQAGDIQFGSTSAVINNAPGAGLSFIADRDIIIGFLDLTFTGGAMPLSFLAGRSGTGRISASGGTVNLEMVNGNVTLGGFTTFSQAGGGTFLGTNSSATGLAGVTLSQTAISAGPAGSLTINGGSTGFSGTGVQMSSVSLDAGTVIIRGTATGAFGTGVQLSAMSVNAIGAATNSIDVRGSGDVMGVEIRQSATLTVAPITASPSSFLRIEGAASNGFPAARIDGGLSSSAMLIAQNGASVQIDGSNGTPDPSKPTIVLTDTSGGGSTDIQAIGGGTVSIGVSQAQVVNINNTNIITDGSLNVRGVSFVALTEATMTSSGPMTVATNNLSIAASGGAPLTSLAVGDAILFRGPDVGTSLITFSAGGSALSTPNGRWLIGATDVNNGSFNPGALAYDFKRYNAQPGDAAVATDVGNGMLFSVPEFATVTGTVQVKTYDATTAATVNNLAATGSALDQPVGLPSISGADFNTANAGTNKDVTLNNLVLQFEDANQKPVYGYLPQYLLRGTVNPAPVTIQVTGVNKVYDATTQVQPVATVTSGLVGLQTLGVITSAQFPVKDVGSYPVSVDVGLTDGTNGGLANNYSLAPTFLTSGSITPASLSVTGLVASNKVYDTTVTASLAGSATVTPLGSDVVSVIASGTAAFSDKNVGIGKSVLVSGFSLTGTDAGNYLPVQPTGLTANITAAPLQVNGLAASNKVYDATVAATLSGSASVTPLGNDIVSVSTTPVGTFADKNVGAGKSVSIGALSLSGTDAGNYTPVAPAALTANITPFQLSLSGVTVNSKVYDATLNATLSGTATANFFAGDSAALSGGTIAFTDKNVGTGKSVQLSGFGLTGADAPNYLAPTATVLTANITPATLNLFGLTAANKVYDGGTTAALTGTPSVTPLASDSVSASGTPLGSFADKNAGTAKQVTVSNVGLSGTDSGNYVLATPPTLTANITPAQLLIDGYTAVNKVYDGTTVATLTGSASFEPLGSDNVTVNGSPVGTFSSKNVGTRSVTLAGLTLGGSDGGNYTPTPSSALSADITPATLTVSGITANNKVYDATTTATVGGSAVTAAFGSDVVNVGGTPLASFSNKNVGTGKSVAVSGYTLSGADAGNYTVAQPTGLSANITPATLQISGVSAANKTYDGSVAATISGSAAVAALGSDVVSVSGTPSASFSSKDVGTAKTVLISGLSLSGADAGNYLVGSAALVSSADITPATLSYIATPVSQTAGLEIPPLTGTVGGFVAGETVQSATTGTLGFTTTATIASVGGQYAIVGSGLAASNYVFVQDAANATALTLNPSQPELIVAKKSADAAPKQALQLMTQPTPPADPGLGGVVDLVSPTPPPSSSSTSVVAASTTTTGTSTPTATALAAPTAFEPVTLSGLSSEALVGMLDARVQYKKVLFADAVSALEKNSALADMPPCRSRADVQAGGCVLTAALKRELQARPAAAAEPALPSAPVPAAAVPAPAAAAAPAAPVAPVAQVFDPSAPPLLASSARRVINASLPQIQRKVALVIGVDRYDDPTIPALANAVGDARAIGKVLESQLGYETVVLENATKKAVVAALNGLAVELGPKDSVILYYAGHGELVEATKLGYWQLSDSDPKRPETWLSNADIGKMVAQLEASQVALISDSCYSGSLVTDQRIRAASGAMDPQQVLSRKSVVVMSSGGNEPVADAGKQGHSPFAFSLINNFRQLSAWQPGGNVFERVRFAVAKELPQRPQYGAFAAGGYQGGDYLFEQRQLEGGTQ